MLLSFGVTNFLSISEAQTVSLVSTKLTGPHEPFAITVPLAGDGILPCAVIYGPNASGKSSIVSAMNRMIRLVLGSHAPQKLDKKLPYNPFRLSTAWNNQPTTFSVIFTRDGVRYDYSFSYDAEKIHAENLDYYPEGRRRKIFHRISNDISFGSHVRGAKKTLAEFTRPNSLFLSVAIQNNHEEFKPLLDFFTSVYISTDIKFATKSISNVFGEHEIDPRSITFLKLLGTGVIGYEQNSVEIPKETRELLNEVVKVIKRQNPESAPTSDGEIDEFGITDDTKEVIIKIAHENEVGETVYFNVEQESLGTRRLLLMLNNIFKVLDEGDLAIIDELDASLHTFAVSSIIELFTNPKININNAQLIATTHDTNLLDTKHLRRDEVWFVEKTRSGNSEYFSLSDFSARREESLEKSYLEGKFGAIPKKFGHWNFKIPQKSKEVI